jgi:hypothetical protein
MILEILFKFLVTVIFLLPIYWVWTHHIDVQRTIIAWKDAVKRGQVGWIETRDADKIYQNGNAVGDVNGQVQEEGNMVIFSEIINTSDLNRTSQFEYQRKRLKIVSIGTMIGNEVTLSGTKQSVLRDVED